MGYISTPPGINKLTSLNGSVTFSPSNGQGSVVDLSASGGGGTASGITVNAVTVTPYTASAAAGLTYYPVYNSSGGTFIFKLPASPASNQAAAIADALNNAGTHNIQIQGNGNTICAYGGTQANITVASNGGSVNPLVWDSTGSQWTCFG